MYIHTSIYIYIMRPTLGNYFEVEPGSGIFFLKQIPFF